MEIYLIQFAGAVLATAFVGLYYWKRNHACVGKPDAEPSKPDLQRILENSNDLICLHSTDACFSYVSGAAKKMLGYDAQDLIGASSESIVHPRDREKFGKAFDSANGQRTEHRMRSKDGDYLWFETLVHPYSDESGNYIQSSSREISTRKKNDDMLRLTASVFEHALEGIMITDARTRIIAVNPAFSDITGFILEDVIGKSPKLLQSGMHDREFYTQMWDSINEYGHFSGELWNKKKNGDVYPQRLNISSIRNEEGEITHYLGIMGDITELKNIQSRLEKLANFDALTDLPNRNLFYDRLTNAMDYAKWHEKRLALLFVDLDGFKLANDNFGHAVGDILLKRVAERLTDSVRMIDTVARIGGDEFVVLIEQETDYAEIASRIIESLGQPFFIEGYVVEISASAGIAVYPGDGEEPDVLMKNADNAMYQIKQSGKNDYLFFSEKSL